MRRRMPSTAKLNELTGWTPQKTLEDVIDDVAAELKSRG